MSLKSEDKVCGIIVTYNIGKDLYKCLDAVYDQVDKLIIVDNGSAAETIEELKKLENRPKIKVVFNGANLGIACALNIGVNYAVEEGAQWLLTLDNDSEAAPAMVQNMFLDFKSLPEDLQAKTAIIVPQYKEKAFNYTEEEENKFRNKKIEFLDTEITSGNLIKTEIFKTTGGFQENLFIDYVDHEFCLRVRKQGYKIMLSPRGILYHSLGNSQRSKVLGRDVPYTNHSELRRYYITRNRMYVWKKYLFSSPAWITHDMACSIKESIKIVFLEKNKKEKLKMMLKGTKDFLTNRYGSFPGKGN